MTFFKSDLAQVTLHSFNSQLMTKQYYVIGYYTAVRTAHLEFDTKLNLQRQLVTQEAS